MPRASAALVLVALLTAAATARPATQADPQVYFGNLHSHTSLSDGSGTPAEAFEHARDTANLDFLAITEHNHAQAGDIANNPALYTGPGTLSLIPTANRFTEEGTFIALYGQEFSTISSGNHVNVIDAPRVIDVPNGQFRRLLEDWLPANLDTLGEEPLLLLNHPATSGSPANVEYGIDDFSGAVEWLAALDRRAALINLINGPSHEVGTNLAPGQPSEGEFRRYLNMGLHVAPTADQDNHKRNWGNATRARTAVLAPTLTKAALLMSMKQRRVYATEDQNLRVVARIGGHLLGSIVVGAAVPAAGSALSVSLVIADSDETSTTYTVEVFADQIGGSDQASVIRTQNVSGNGSHSITGVSYGGGPQYFFLRIRQSDGNRAWTAPVWFDPAGNVPATPSGDPVSSISVSLVVDPVAETARITNTGTSPVVLTGWRLVSVRGNQIFDQFPSGFTLAPGTSVTITSGPSAATGSGFIRWTNQAIWNNSGDPGRLMNQDGIVVAQSGGLP